MESRLRGVELRVMLTAIQRSLLALTVAGGMAIYMKLRGGEETPAHEGGWRELSGDDLK